jgi:hypothetical protein
MAMLENIMINTPIKREKPSHLRRIKPIKKGTTKIKAPGMSFAVYLKENLYGRLGMDP